MTVIGWWKACFCKCDRLGQKAVRKDEPVANQLAAEKSPYLLQHAENPVDWYPWGEEAFQLAQEQNKPIFLSIGYSTCRWCHIMERESFSDSEVAALLNRVCVAIKVDREERPDIDHLYMEVCHRMTGSGGWPLTILMTPSQKPFFAGTYFPKRAQAGRIGLTELLERVAELWTGSQDDIHRSAEEITAALQVPERQADSSKKDPDERLLRKAFDHFSQNFDDEHGGFGDEPKFPSPHQLSFLLRFWKRTQERSALEMVEKTLQALRRGGIYDHIGFGFHRYSTDRAWLLPHFEKMLYDQSLLAISYLEAYQITGNQGYADTAREVFSYVAENMRAREGGFYSAEDAESEGEEGKVYVWTPAEVRKVLSRSEAELAIRIFNIEDGGNFVDQGTGERTGSSIIHMKQARAEIAAEMGIEDSDLERRLEAARKKLLAARKERVQPSKDDKVLTDWNGLMMAALAKGAQVLQDSTYSRLASEAADFILNTLGNSRGGLLKRFRDGEARLPAFADDYAYFIWGLLELYEATFEVRYLETALELNDYLLDHFWDEEQGGLFFSEAGADDVGKLIVRRKEVYDGALPSGNSVAALNFLRLSRMTGRQGLEDKAWATIRAFSGQAGEVPWAYTQLLTVLDFALGPSHEIVVVGKRTGRDTAVILSDLQRLFLPNSVLLLKTADEEKPAMDEIAPFMTGYRGRPGRATVYVCQDFSCQAPTSVREEVWHKLGFTKRDILW